MERKKSAQRGKTVFFSNVKKLLSLSLMQQYVFTIRLIIHARNQKRLLTEKKISISAAESDEPLPLCQTFFF